MDPKSQRRRGKGGPTDPLGVELRSVGPSPFLIRARLGEVVGEVRVDQPGVLAATQPQLQKKVGQEMGRHLAQGRGAQVAQIQAVVLVAVVLLLVEFVVLEQRAALAS